MQTHLKVIFLTVTVLTIAIITWQNIHQDGEVNVAEGQLNKGAKNSVSFLGKRFSETSSDHSNNQNSNLYAEQVSQKSVINNDNFYQNIASANNFKKLQDYFWSPNSDSNLAFASALDYVNMSEQAFNYVSNLYLETEDDWLEQRALDLLYKTIHPEKVSFISSMVNASSPSIQAKGIKLLSSNIETTSQYEVVVGLIIDASYMTENAKDLKGLMAAFRYSERKEISNEFTKKMMRERLQELASDTRPELAAYALSELMQVSQDETTLNIVKAHLAHGSPEIQLNALKSMGNVTYASDIFLPTLNVMMNDNSLPREIRALAAKRLVYLENQERK